MCSTLPVHVVNCSALTCQNCHLFTGEKFVFCQIFTAENMCFFVKLSENIPWGVSVIHVSVLIKLYIHSVTSESLLQ